jgi:hypothetical protein
MNPFSPLVALSGPWVDSSPSWGVCRTEFVLVSFELKTASTTGWLIAFFLVMIHTSNIPTNAFVVMCFC